MTNSRIIKHLQTDKINRDELNYREKIQPCEYNYGSLAQLSDGRINILPLLSQIRGKVLELGAGSCWLSSELSRKEPVTEVFSLDMSEQLLTVVAPQVMEYLGADISKITRIVGDFNDLSIFGNSTIDFVLFDAALHHIPLNSYREVFSEIHRVLKPTGQVIAIREPFLSLIPLVSHVQCYTFGRYEKKYGVTENTFSKNQWMRLLTKHGFDCQMVKYNEIYYLTPSISWKDKIKKIISLTPLKYIFYIYRPSYIVILNKCIKA